MRTTLALLLVVASSSFAHAQASATDELQARHSRADRRAVEAFRVGTYFVLGAGGEGDLDSEVPALGGEGDLDATVGFGLRAEMPVMDYLSIGGLFELVGYQFDDTSADRNLAIDMSFWIKGRYVIELTRDLDLEVYLGLPFGFTGYFPDGDAFDNSFGFNTGLLGGGQLILGRFAVFTEMGWRHRHTYWDEENGAASIDFDLAHNQFAFHLGAMLLL